MKNYPSSSTTLDVPFFSDHFRRKQSPVSFALRSGKGGETSGGLEAGHPSDTAAPSMGIFICLSLNPKPNPIIFRAGAAVEPSSLSRHSRGSSDHRAQSKSSAAQLVTSVFFIFCSFLGLRMYLSHKARPLEFSEEEGGGDMMMMEVVVGNGGLQQQDQQMILAAESSGEDLEAKAPKKRAETWVQDETRCLIALRREVDGLFNTSKSNRHLWDQISVKMRERGFDRSPIMCTDKWRNLLKEFKKASASAKMSYHKELEELLRDRNKNASYKSSTTSKVDSFVQFSDKGLQDGGISFGSLEGHNRSSYGRRVVLVKWGEYTRKIGIDGTSDAIKEAIKSTFGLRTKRAFWLEDEDEVVRSLDRDMPLGTYTLHLDEGLKIKVCLYDDTDRMPVQTEEKTLYTEDDLHDFLSRRGWTCLREFTSFRCVDTLNELRQGGMYQGVRMSRD